MHILTRYVLFDLIKVIVLTLFGMTTLLILVFVAKEAVDQGLGPVTVARLVPYILPEAMRYAVPGTVLLAVTSLYGRMAASNELVAIKSLGISPMAVIWPMLAMATLISFGTVWLNDIAVSWGRLGMQRVVLESLEEIVYGQLKSRRTFSASGISITVSGVEGRRMIQPTVTIHGMGDKPDSLITAREAELEANPIEGAVTLRLFQPDGRVGNIKGYSPDMEEVTISLEDFTRTKRKRVNPSNCPLAKIPNEVERQEAIITRTRQEMTAMTTYHLITGDMDGLSGEDWQSRQQTLGRAASMLARLRTEPHRRWANGFCCLSFVLVGAPIAIRRRQGEFLASFFVCFLPILGLFYPMLFLGIEWAKNGDIPPIAVWTGNVVFAVWGIWLLRRVLRH